MYVFSLPWHLASGGQEWLLVSWLVRSLFCLISTPQKLMSLCSPSAAGPTPRVGLNHGNPGQSATERLPHWSGWLRTIFMLEAEDRRTGLQHRKKII